MQQIFKDDSIIVSIVLVLTLHSITLLYFQSSLETQSEDGILPPKRSKLQPLPNIPPQIKAMIGTHLQSAISRVKIRRLPTGGNMIITQPIRKIPQNTTIAPTGNLPVQNTKHTTFLINSNKPGTASYQTSTQIGNVTIKRINTSPQNLNAVKQLPTYPKPPVTITRVKQSTNDIKIPPNIKIRRPNIFVNPPAPVSGKRIPKPTYKALSAQKEKEPVRTVVVRLGKSEQDPIEKAYPFKRKPRERKKRADTPPPTLSSSSSSNSFDIAPTLTEMFIPQPKNNLEQIIKSLIMSHLLQPEDAALIRELGNPIKAAFCSNQTYNSVKSFEMFKKFALNLNFYSPQGYEQVYAHHQYKKYLPSLTTISSWYKSVNGAPGFCDEAFQVLANVASLASNNSEKLYINIVVHELSIREDVIKCDGKTWGYVDIGDGGESMDIAKNILIFIAVGLNRSWRLPLAYFPISNLSAIQKKNLIVHCVRNVVDARAEVVGVVVNGRPINFAVSHLLGCNYMEILHEQTFKVDTYEMPLIIHFNPCEMMKMIRDTFAELKVFITEHYERIEWKYLERLIKLAESYEISLSSNENIMGDDDDTSDLKLKHDLLHEYFTMNKIQPKLAVQSLSKDIADALDYCRIDLNLEEFSDSSATSKFIYTLNNIFDILTSKSDYETGFYISPLTSENYTKIKSYCDECIDFLSQIQAEDGSYILDHRQSTGFLGIITCLNNLETIHDRLLMTEELPHVLTHKLNQDHTRIIFGNLESYQNKNVYNFHQQFKLRLSQIQLHEQDLENYVSFDNETNNNICDSCNPIEAINNTMERVQMFNLDSINYKIIKDYDDILETRNYLFDLETLEISRSEYKLQRIKFIACNIVSRLHSTLLCSECLACIDGDYSKSNDLIYAPTKFLRKPSESVVQICEITEASIAIYKNLVKTLDDVPTFFNCVAIATKFNLLQCDLFKNTKHCEPNLHYNLLAQSILELFLNIRIYYLKKTFKSENFNLRKLFE